MDALEALAESSGHLEGPRIQAEDEVVDMRREDAHQVVVLGAEREGFTS